MKILFRPSLCIAKQSKKSTAVFSRSPLVHILALSKSDQSEAYKHCRASKALVWGPPIPWNAEPQRPSCPGKIPHKKKNKNNFPQTPTEKYFAVFKWLVCLNSLGSPHNYSEAPTISCHGMWQIASLKLHLLIYSRSTPGSDQLLWTLCAMGSGPAGKPCLQW